ncbi:site-specific integrase [Prolixibacteraceae bacterium Z1-6]|uniref:Site-specific integrase n=1 Tax=Draconibacterium aestuarii TaxID=2998507 RepID=A0A9X3F5C9_9BACT|nr:site-specific integrase [Prolixibacteraceae bacterium Z1-6]
MSSPKVFINDSYKKKDGSSAIYILVHIGGQSIKFATGVSCDPDKFDYTKCRVKGNGKKIKDDNLVIERGLALMNDIMVRYRLQNEVLTPETLKKEWKNPTRRVNFYVWMDETIKSRKGDLADSSLKQHTALKSKLEDWWPKLSFADIDHEFIEQFRRHLKVKKKNDLNTIHNNLKNLKAYLNIAVRQGVIKENPFDRVKLKRSAPDRIFLTEEELLDLWELYHSKKMSDHYYPVLRHFLFMCFTGLRISDLKEVTFDNIQNNRLVFFPVKTKGSKKTGVKVPLNKYANELITDEGRKEGMLFNMVSEVRMNKRLKEIATAAGIPKKISNHSGRHTFATIYLQKTKDVAGLQKLLGHSNINQTMVYVHINDDDLKLNMDTFDKNLFKKEKSKKKV